MKTISVVVPVYNEEENIQATYDALKGLFDNELKKYDYEFIFCDNASKDTSPELLRGLAEADKKVKIIYNSRNFGAIRSGYNGLLNATGDAVVVEFPADLQDPPELIPEFVTLWEQGYKVCYGIRAVREEGKILAGVRKIFYRMIHKLVDFELPKDVGHFQLIDRSVLNEIRKFDDYNPYTRGIIAYCGFKSVGIPYTWRTRRAGKKKSNFLSYLGQALNAVISFSNLPLRAALIGGFAISALSILYGAFSLIASLFGPSDAPPGIPTLIIGMFFMGGVQLFVLGMIGEYLFAVHSLVRRKPLVVENERLNFDTDTKKEKKAA